MEYVQRITYFCCFGTLSPLVECDIEIRVETTPHTDLEPPTDIVSCQPLPLPPERHAFYFIQQNLETSKIEVYGIPVYQMELLEQLM